MWRSKTHQDKQEEQASHQLSSSIIHATPLTVIEQQSSGLNGKTASTAITISPATVSGGATQEGPLKRGLCRRGGNRLVHPRLSIRGKPMNPRQRHRDPRYRKLRFQVNNFLERPRGWKAISYHMIV